MPFSDPQQQVGCCLWRVLPLLKLGRAAGRGRAREVPPQQSGAPAVATGGQLRERDRRERRGPRGDRSAVRKGWGSPMWTKAKVCAVGPGPSPLRASIFLRATQLPRNRSITVPSGERGDANLGTAPGRVQFSVLPATTWLWASGPASEFRCLHL